MNRKRSARGQMLSVVDTLGRRMAAGEYAVGETLPVEQKLADSLQVGRNALREAVKVLSGKGLICTAPRSGTRVRPREDWNMLDPDVLRWHADPDVATGGFMLDLIEVRRIVEPKAAELAAARATREDIAAIMTACEAMVGSGDDHEKRLEADIAFHSAILKASHNEVLNHFHYAIAAYLKAHARLGGQLPEQESQEDLDRHQQIAWAIAAGRAKSAYSETVTMLSVNRSHFMEEETSVEKGDFRFRERSVARSKA